MLTLRDLQIQAVIYKELVMTFRIWTRPTNMSSRISSNLLTAERGGGGGGALHYMGYMSMCHGIGLTVFEFLILKKVSFLPLFAGVVFQVWSTGYINCIS